MRKAEFLVITFLVAALCSAQINVLSIEVALLADESQSLILANYEVHDPILIASDGDFETQGWPGSGTAEDPYVIEGLMIVGPYAENQAAIRVNDVSASFVIRNCVLYDVVKMTSPRFGIVVPFNENVIIESNVFDGITDWGWDEEYGINVVDGRNMTIINNQISNCHYGICDGNGWLMDSIVSANIVNNCSHGIRISGGNNVNITNNIVSNSQTDGILVDSSHSVVSGNTINAVENGLVVSNNDVMVSDNTISGSIIGILVDSSHSVVSGNTINAVENGLVMSNNDVMVSDNTISGSIVGILVHSQYCTFFNNTIEENERGMELTLVAIRNNITWNGFVNNNISVWNDASLVSFDYNYWSDYNGSDDNLDGIGDTPYESFFEGAVDNHPLMYWPWYNPTATSADSQFQLTAILGLGIGFGVLLSVIVFVVLRKRE